MISTFVHLSIYHRIFERACILLFKSIPRCIHEKIGKLNHNLFQIKNMFYIFICFKNIYYSYNKVFY